MTASSRGPYKPRFEVSSPRFGITPPKIALLAYIAQCGMLTTSQCRWIQGLSQKQAYDQLQDLFQHGYLKRFAVARSLLMWPEVKDPMQNLGLSETIHFPTPKAIKMLLEHERIAEENAAIYDPADRQPLSLRHDLLARDMRCFLEDCSRNEGGGVEVWLNEPNCHTHSVRPDALFLYRLANGKTLSAAVEADRGTERGSQWSVDKPGQYARGRNELFVKMGNRAGTQILVVALDSRRRDWIAEQITGTPIAGLTWVATRDDLKAVGRFTAPIWRRSGEADLLPLIRGA